MKRKMYVLIAVAVVAGLLLSSGLLFDIYVPKEDLLSYEIYNPQGRLSVDASSVTTTMIKRYEKPYLRKDFGSENQILDGDFEIYLRTKVTYSESQSIVGILMLNQQESTKSLHLSDVNNDGLVFYMYRYSENVNPNLDLHRFILADRNSPDPNPQNNYCDYSPNAIVSMNVDYWFSIFRVGRVITLKAYSNEAMTPEYLLRTDTYTYNTTTPDEDLHYRYVYTAYGYGVNSTYPPSVPYNTRNASILSADFYLQEPPGTGPTASFTWSPTSPFVGETVSFDASGSLGSLTKYEWDWENDGTYDNEYTSPLTTHTFSSAGSKTVKLRVTDSYLQTATTTNLIVVQALPGAPTVATNPATVVTQTGATLNGQLADTGGSVPVTVWFEYGLTTEYGSVTSSSQMSLAGSFNKQITGLSSNTAYHFRAVASNDAGEDIGEDATFTTGIAVIPPTVVTSPATSVGSTTVMLNGQLNSLGGASSCLVWFEYGTSTSYGSETTTTTMTSVSSFSKAVTGLTPGTPYHFKAFASNGAGESSGVDLTFTTSSGTTYPSVSTLTASNVGLFEAKLNGQLISTGGSTCNVWFQYGTTTSYGSSTTPGSMTSPGTFDYILTGLSANTVYHFRAVAQNSIGPTYGDDVEFTTTSVQTYTLTVNTKSNIGTIIPGATVTANSNTQTSSETGVATFELPEGTYTITVSASNYQPWAVSFFISSDYTVTSANIPTGSSAPIACFSWSPVKPNTGSAATFDSSCTIGAEEYRWQWEAGGEWTAWTSNMAIYHTYAGGGTKMVTLQAKNSIGTSTVQHEVLVSEQTPGFEILILLFALIVAFSFFRRKRGEI